MPMLKLLNSIKPICSNGEKLSWAANLFLWKNVSPTTKFTSTSYPKTAVKNKFLSTSVNSARLLTLNFSPLKEPGKIPLRNLTSTTATSGSQTIKMPRNVCFRKKDMPSGTTIRSEWSELTRSDRTTKLTRNFSLKSAQASKNLKLSNFKKTST